MLRRKYADAQNLHLAPCTPKERVAEEQRH
jgi:hypothetical protein